MLLGVLCASSCSMAHHATLVQQQQQEWSGLTEGEQ
jgi:hypothetical protein